MRELILPGFAALALCACGSEQTAEERAAAERNVTSEVVTTTDTTAIDAATGEAANMAADVDFMPELANELGNDVEAQGGGNRATNASGARRSTGGTGRPERRDDDGPETNTL
jgi:membrane protein involved in colicin uptake